MRSLIVLGVSGCIGLSIPTPAQAQDFVFHETFAAPPLTAGTSAASWEDGWLNGDNGWQLTENFTQAGYANFGQRSNSADGGGVFNNWPGGDFLNVGNVRNTGGSGSAAKPLPELHTGQINITLTDALSNSGVLDLYLLGPARTQYSGVLQDELALRLRIGGITGSGNGGKFEVAQIGGLDTVVANGSTKTVDNRDLLWRTSLDGNNANGDYAVLTLDFDARANTASVVITTINAAGSASSTAPVEVPFNLPVNSISRATLVSVASPDASFGSLTWLGDFAVSGNFVEARPTDFGRQWVRNNPFTIMGAAHERGTPASFDVNQYLNAGMSVVFSNKDQSVAQKAADAGAAWHGHGWAQLFNDTYRYIPHENAGWMVFDEPQTAEDMDWAALNAQRMREQHPDVLTYVNALPKTSFPNANYASYDAYLDAIVHQVKSDVLMFDAYPFRGAGVTETDNWFSNVMAVRNKALANNLPYWAWLQSFHYPTFDTRTPSESDTRWNGFTLLTAGYTGLNYFMYDNEDSEFTGDFFDTSGNPTAFFAYASAANHEYARLGRALHLLTNTDVRFVSGGVGSTPGGLSNWSSGAGGDTRLLAVSVNNNTAHPDKDALVGVFTDDADETYFMLTNLFHAAGMGANAAAVTFDLTFANDIDAIYRLSRITGAPERVDLTAHALSLSLSGGTGDLFKYDNGYFPGITPGDADLDGDVDLSDLGTLATSYGANAGGTWLTGDFDLDGDIDLNDLGVLATNYGAGSAQALTDFQSLVSVPEPAGLLLLGLSALALRRRK